MRITRFVERFCPPLAGQARALIPIAGAAVALAGCGGDGSADFSVDPLATQQQGLVSAQLGSAAGSLLDIAPPVAAGATSATKSGAASASYVQAAQAFAAQNAARYGLAPGATGLELLSIKESLLGTHVT